MKRKLLLFLLSICFFLPDFAATGQYNFIRVDGGSGLSNSHVKSIIQDSYGFIWLGTRNGLNRYDGVSMKLYNCYDETLQHGNQVISALFSDLTALIIDFLSAAIAAIDNRDDTLCPAHRKWFSPDKFIGSPRKWRSIVPRL